MLSRNRVKYIQSLGQKKFRDQEGLFIAEGPKIVNEFFTAVPHLVKEVLALPEWIHAQHALPASLIPEAITAADLERISQLQTPNQVLALIRKNTAEKTADTNGGFFIALDTIQDPGNLGTIIRIADWYGIDTIICNTDCADCYNPKVVQSTMGSLARVRLVYTDLAGWLNAHTQLPVYAAALNGEPVHTLGKINDGVLIIGNESKGIHPAILEKAMHRITIPRVGKAESLNAAVATAIILSHTR